MNRFLLASVVSIFALASTLVASAANRTDINNELDHAAKIIQEMTGPNASAGIPSSVLEGAKCIAVIPGLKQAGFIIGGRHGDGVATCKLSDNQWSPPAPFSLTGGSFGLQAGAQSIDLVMMVMNDQGMQALRSGHFKVGGEVSGAAGPVGRQASASAGWKAAILTYSRTKGVYAGVTLKGAELQQDDSATKALYGSDVHFSQILEGNAPTTHDAAVHQFLMTVHHAEQNAAAH